MTEPEQTTTDETVVDTGETGSDEQASADAAEEASADGDDA